MQLSGLIKKTEYKEISGSIDIDIKGLAYDSRKCKRGFLFAALRGVTVDGHDFISAAIEKGASAIICEQINDDFLKMENITFIVVPNSRKALALISHAFYGYPTEKMTIIGVTGTNGKTTTTYLIKSILELNGNNCGLIGTTGTMFGTFLFLPSTNTTPESLELCMIFSEMFNAGIDTAIMEVSSHSLDQSRVAGIDFDIALFTNLTPDHLDYHKDMNDYAAAKKKLFDNLKPESLAVIFDNSDYSDYLTKDCKGTVLFLGRNKTDDFIITDERMNLGESEFVLRTKFSNLPDISIKTKLSGSFNIDNAALAATATYATGVDDEIIAEALFESEGAPGRMQSIYLKNGGLALVDYAHTPDAIEKALTSCRGILSSAGNGGRLICVFGCGGDRDKSKRPVMGGISSMIADLSIITSDNPRTENPHAIISEIYDGVETQYQEKVKIISDRAEAIEFAINFAGANDIVLVAGKGHENYQVIGTDKVHFDDSEEIKKAAGIE